MLNFDTNHSYIEGNMNERKGKKVKNIIISGLIFASLLTFSGCAKDVPCDISDNHAHYYVNEDYLGRYIVSEKSSVSGLNRTDNYIAISKEDSDFLEFINKNGLFKIDENQEVISNIIDNHQDYTEYKYKYPVLVSGVRVYKYNWTSNPNDDDVLRIFTGEERVCHYVYYGYKIEKNENGGYALIKSDPVNNLAELPDEYQYIKEQFYDVVNLYDKNEVYYSGKEQENNNIEEYSQPTGKSR